MRWHQLKSSNIAGCSYSRKVKVLIVDFHSGFRYAYRGVPERLYRRFLNAKSHGEFFAENIKDKFEYQKLAIDSSEAEEINLQQVLQQSLDEILQKGGS